MRKHGRVRASMHEGGIRPHPVPLPEGEGVLLNGLHAGSP
jgi:hypothetical protein